MLGSTNVLGGAMIGVGCFLVAVGFKGTAVAARVVSHLGHTYISPDGQVRAVVSRAGKLGGESRVEIRSKLGWRLYARSFGSLDGQHGAGVVRAGWSPDSQFFVWSMENSGGHAPWNSPTYFFSRKLKTARSLDAIVGGVTSASFHLKAPDVLATRRRKSKSEGDAPVSVRLSKLR